MLRIRNGLLLLVALLAAIPASAGAQEATPPATTQSPTVPLRPREIQLVFEREVFSYHAAGRRDPFRVLADEGMGPLFSDLTLRMIIHSPLPGKSVALVIDGAKRIHRLRKGDVVGNATVLDITPTRVTFSVEDFGNRRQETLDLKTQKEGA